MTTRVAAITCCLRPDTVTSFGMTVTDFNATLSGICPIGTISTGNFFDAYSSTLIVTVTLGIPNAIMSEASLSFLGLGVKAPMASWGSMISFSQPYIRSATYYSVIPGLAIIITVLAFNMLGDGLRDALDPKLRS